MALNVRMNCNIESGPKTAASSEQLTLAEAARLTPGRPSANCLWRWCRRGVLVRDGLRIRLRHVRLGGRVFTTRAWLDEFGRELAEADRAYFEGRDAAARDLPPRDPALGSPRDRRRAARERSARADAAARQLRVQGDLDAELSEEGL